MPIELRLLSFKAVVKTQINLDRSVLMSVVQAERLAVLRSGSFGTMHLEDSGSRTPFVLIVEDDERLAELTRDYLESNGFKTEIIGNGDEAVNAIIEMKPDLVVLDVMLPGKDGLEVCRAVRGQFKNPILMLTARSEDVDQVLGLEMGADDYVAKPVRPRVLLARIRALLRRTQAAVEHDGGSEGPNHARLEFMGLVIDNNAREVWLGEQLVDLTSAEYDLLWLLAANAGKILSREEIFERLRGIEYDGQDRSIDVRVSRIRPKIGDDPLNPRRIKTVRSKGYLFVRESGSDSSNMS